MLALGLIVAPLPPVQGGYYRWVDEDGNVHYSDAVPPAYIEGERTEFSRQGLPVTRVPRAKTAEELRRDEELQRLRRRQTRLLEELESADRMLLRTFRTESDLAMARDGKLAAVDASIQVARNRIQRQEQFLARLRAEAADMERLGRVVPERLREDIAKTASSIAEAETLVEVRDELKRRIRGEYERNLQRFRELTGREAGAEMSLARDMEPVFHEVLPCADEAACERLWRRSSDYIREQVAGGLQRRLDDRVLVAQISARGGGGRLVLSRIRDPDGAGSWVFLELQCPLPRAGAHCRNEEVLRIVEGFRPAVAPDG